MVDPENHSPEADMYQRLWQPSCVVGSRRHRPETIDVECGCNSKSCFGGPVEEKAFTDLVHIESGLEGGGGGRRGSAKLDSGSLCVPSSAGLVVRRYGTAPRWFSGKYGFRRVLYWGRSTLFPVMY